MKHTLRVQRFALATAAVGCLAATVAGCVPLVVGGAMAAGGMVATDRRTSGTQLDDEGIELRSANRIRDALGDRAHVNVTSFNRQVLLTGEVASAQDRQTVERLVAQLDNVNKVVNELGIGPVSSLAQRSNDSLITGRVKAALVDARDLFANSFKIVTERNVVYMMGRVTKREAQRATDIARSIGSVEKVVRALEIISEEDLQRGVLVSSPAPAPAAPPPSNNMVTEPAPAPAAPGMESSGVVVTPIPPR
jgi:osmotically-inducible protein OsmY